MIETIITPAFGEIGNALKSTAADHIVAIADDLYDTNSGKYQSEINSLVLQGGSGASNHFFMTTDQYAELVANGEVVIDGKTIVYDENAYYALYELESEE